MKLVFLGPPGAGKGTQAERICERYGLVHISTGDMLRHHINSGSKIGNWIGELINKGELVPDDFVIKMVVDGVAHKDAAKGFILDGFPRTIQQAQKLSELLDIDLAVNIDVPMDRLLSRITHRRSCVDCDIVYNTSELKTDTCPKCGKKLVIRKDDTPEVASERFRVYNERTLPIINYYQAMGCLANINGDQSIDEVNREIVREIEKVCL